MKKLDDIAINDCVLTLENESAFYSYFFKPYCDNLKKFIKKGVYSRDAAVKGLQERIRAYFKSCDNLQICKFRYKYIPTKYDLSKPERVEVAKGLIETFELHILK